MSPSLNSLNLRVFEASLLMNLIVLLLLWLRES